VVLDFMQLTNTQLAQLIDLAKNDAPNETCGILGGKDGRARKVFSLPNDSPEPRVQYNADPLALLEAFREIESRGWEHLAIYHSHPASPAYPSPTDIARAFYPKVIYILVSLMNPGRAIVRGFQINQGKVSEVTLEIEEDHESPRTNQRDPARRTHRPHAGRAVAALSKRRPPRGNTVRKRR
jgi:proteasome lid subunit RPN8/RPN11